MTIPAVKNQPYSIFLSLASNADPALLQDNPTLETGDVKVWNGTTFVNITSLPTVAGRTVLLTLTAAEMNYDLTAVVFHDQNGAEWQDLLVSIQTDTKSIGDVMSTAEDIWTYTSGGGRSLTQSPGAILQTLTSGQVITIKRGDSISIPITLIGDLTNAEEIWFSVKTATSQGDSQSLIQISLSDGLLVLNGKPATDADLGSLVINTVLTGDITVTLSSAASALLAPARNTYWDIQVRYCIDGGEADIITVSTPRQGTCHIEADVTRKL